VDLGIPQSAGVSQTAINAVSVTFNGGIGDSKWSIRADGKRVCRYERNAKMADQREELSSILSAGFFLPAGQGNCGIGKF